MSDLREQLEQVRSRFGALTPNAVVSAARPADAPLHPRFTWDDTVAGEKWREREARELIRSIQIVYKETSRGPTSIRGYVSVSHSSVNEREYVPTDDALTDPVTREIVLLAARRELRAHRARYGHLNEYADLLADHLRDVKSS